VDKRIEQLIHTIRELDEELRTRLYEQQRKLFKATESGRVEFENGIKEAHRQLKVGVLAWLRTSRPRHIISAPVIYGLLIPVLIFDLSITIYQVVCFRLYRIAPVKRSKYIVIDRHRLAYLNIFEKLNCIYCEYVNGLMAYVREIAARTEQYWCPIKHAHKMLDSHKWYAEFIDYGDAENYHERLQQIRKTMKNVAESDLQQGIAKDVTKN
jgi:hypothetical protein